MDSKEREDWVKGLAYGNYPPLSKRTDEQRTANLIKLLGEDGYRRWKEDGKVRLGALRQKIEEEEKARKAP